MNKSEFLKFSRIEQTEINEKINEVKEAKLKMFFLELLSNGEFDYVVKIVNRKIQFYAELKTMELLNKTLEDMSNSISRNSVIDAIGYINKIEKEEHKFIKEIFIDKVLINIKEIEGFTQVQLSGSPFHVKILELGLKLLKDNKQYINMFKGLKLNEFEVLIKSIELDNELSVKNNNMKLKIKI